MEKTKNVNPVEEIKRLLSIESITGNEKELAYYLVDRFKKMGCRTSLFEAAPDRYNVLAIIEGTESDKPGLLFHGHIDTVPAYNMKDAFTPYEINGHIHGRGSVDQKGGLAAIISAFESYISSGMKNRKSIVFVGVIDEESEHRGSMALKEMAVEADFAIITEPTALKLGIGCKGTAPIRVDIQGRAAHGCRPWLGVNALLAGMDITREILNEPLPETTIRGIGKVKASWNLGRMEGGDVYNIVPDRCTLWFDRRLIPGETQEQIKKSLHKIIQNYSSKNHVVVNAEIARPDWNWDPIKKRGLLPALTEFDSEIVDLVRKAHRAVEGEDPVLFFTDGYQEMDFLVNDLGIESIQYGPGDSSLCHTDNEQLDISELKRCSKVYLKLIQLICE
jgi:succinyl-diaminopimelate desuccinylase